MEMKKYLSSLHATLESMTYSDADGHDLLPDAAVQNCLERLKGHCENTGKVIVVGNGGSAAIASHTAIDFMKNGDIQTVCFNEGALLTCYGNDFGYENIFAKPITKIAQPLDTLIAISSSGRSPNILNAVAAAKLKGCYTITFSGFKSDNPLRQLGDLNIYVPSLAYGFVELSHQVFIHMILDMLMATKENSECSYSSNEAHSIWEDKQDVERRFSHV